VAGDAEVGDPRPVLGVEQDVRRLEVSMDDAEPVRVGQAGRDSRRDPRRLLVGQRPSVADASLERAAGQELEHHVRPVLALAEIEDARDVRVRERRHGPRLALEPLPVGVGAEHLHGDPASEVEVLGLPHRRRSAVTEPPLEPVAAADHRADHPSRLPPPCRR
jgi:hypothetical protein